MVRISFPPPVDFQRLLFDLQGLRMTGPEIQAASGVRRGAISADKSGACHPSFQKGEALIAVWCRRTGGVATTCHACPQKRFLRPRSLRKI